MSSPPKPQAENVGVDDIVVPPVYSPPEDKNVLYELEKASLNNEALRQDIKGRGDWGTRVFWLLLGWLLAVLAVLLLQGFRYYGFHLDNSILITFITTTTINVLSLGYIVANYLFPKSKP